MATVPREVLKWAQSLQLGAELKNPRNDLANGVVIAKVFASAYPQVCGAEMRNVV